MIRFSSSITTCLSRVYGFIVSGFKFSRFELSVFKSPVFKASVFKSPFSDVSVRPIVLLSVLCALASCSTTRLLTDDQLRLADNHINILNDDEYKASELEPYIKQKPSDKYIGNWNPRLYIYNWSSGRNTFTDRFFEKIGTPPVVFDSTSISKSIDGMKTHLEYSGYYNSEVTSHKTVTGKDVDVTYNVKLGKRYPVGDIKYQVTDTLLSRLIAIDTARCFIRKGDFLSQQNLEDESERLAAIFRNNGYWGFTKNYFFFYADTIRNPGIADLTVRINDYTRNESPSSARPHRRYTIGDVSIIPQNGLKVKQKFLDNLNRIESGVFFSEETINNTYNRFTAISLFSSVNVNLENSPEDSTKVDCDILLTPSKLQSIKTNLEGSFNSTGLFGISPSLSYSHKNFFGSGEIFNLGFRGNFQFMMNNPAKANEFAVSSGLSIPNFLFLPSSIFKTTVPRTEINVSFNYQDRPEYTRNIISTSYGYSWSTNGRKLNMQVYPLKANIVRMFDMSDDFSLKIRDPYLLNSYRNHFDLGGQATFLYSSNPVVNPKTTYFYLRSQTDFAGNLVSVLNSLLRKDDEGSRLIWGVPYSQYVRSEFSAVQTIRFGASNQFALAGRLLMGVGYAYGNSSALPFEQFFYAGGANSMRGWQNRAVGPGCAPVDSSFAIINQTGDMHLEANAEFRFPMFWKVQGGLFLDAGNVWNIKQNDSVDPQSVFGFDNLARSIAFDWGLGLRLDFNMILIRLDMGFKTYDPRFQSWYGPSRWLKKDGYALHFGIGYPF